MHGGPLGAPRATLTRDCLNLRAISQQTLAQKSGIFHADHPSSVCLDVPEVVCLTSQQSSFNCHFIFCGSHVFLFSKEKDTLHSQSENWRQKSELMRKMNQKESVYMTITFQGCERWPLPLHSKMGHMV